MRKLLLIFALMAPLDSGLVPLNAQDSSAATAFDVVAIKLSNGDRNTPSGISTGHGRLSAKYVTLQRCIMGAYGLSANQVIGGPSWISETRFDIDAETTPEINDDLVFMEMLKLVLSDRFALKFHRDNQPQTVFVLRRGLQWGKLTPSSAIAAISTASNNGHDISLSINRTDIDGFALSLSRRLDREVINETGITGSFDVRLHWTADSHLGDQDHDVISLSTALKEQLGLSLRTAKRSVPILVLDSVSKPSAN